MLFLHNKKSKKRASLGHESPYENFMVNHKLIIGFL